MPTLGRYNGWLLIAYPGFVDQYSKLSNEVKRLARNSGGNLSANAKVKRMAALQRLVFEIIPEDPAAARYLLGNTLSAQHRAWRRAKFGGQYRLFFRFDSAAKIIIYAWVNDEDTLRTYGSKTDAYAVFLRMLESGKPPSTWTDLLEESD